MKRGSPRPRPQQAPSGHAAPQAAFVPPYPPSWFNHLEAWIERRTGPFWLPYVALGVVLLGIETGLNLPPGGGLPAWNPLHAYLAWSIPTVLGLLHGLDRLAEQSFDSYQPALRTDAAGLQLLRYQLTVLPRRAAWLAAGGFILFGVVVFLSPPALALASGAEPDAAGRMALKVFRDFGIARSPASLLFNALLFGVIWSAVGTLLYHTVRQLHWVSRIYSQHTRVDLLKPGPLYHLSRITAGTAIAMMVIVYLILSADRRYFGDPRNVAGAVLFALLAGMTFVLPLLGIHRVLVSEKELLLDESSDRLKTALLELHRRLEKTDLRDMDALNKAIASLEMERNLLGRIPTWPWQPETVRTFLVALLLPLALWLAQALLGRLLPS